VQRQLRGHWGKQHNHLGHPGCGDYKRPPNTAQPTAAPELVFDPVDTGVLSVRETLTSTELMEVGFPGPEEDGGARFEATGCRATWFGRWDIGESRHLRRSDPGHSGGPGAFTLPITGIYPSVMEGLPWGETTFEFTPDDLGDSSLWRCSFAVTGGDPVHDDPIDLVSARLDVKPPQVLHSPGSLQGWLERLDLLGASDPWLALVWMAAVQDEFPFDVVYLREGHVLERVEYTEDRPCLGLRLVYDDGAETVQFAGCPPDISLLRGFDQGNIVLTDTGWHAAAYGEGVAYLTPVPWEGLAGVAIEGYDAWTPTTNTTPPSTTFPPGAVPPAGLSPFPGQQELIEAWERWNAQGPGNYRFRIAGGSAWIAFGSYDVYVVDGGVSVVPVPLDDLLAGVGMFGPVERLFAPIESIPTNHLDVRYDPVLGYPTSIYFDKPCIDEEWRFRISDLEPFDGDSPAHGLESPPGRLRWTRYDSVSLIAEVTIGAPQRHLEYPYSPGWVVEVHDPTIHYIRRQRWRPGDPFTVLDSARSGPRLLRDHEGERLILFMYRPVVEDGTWHILWAARYTDNGLMFIGPEAEFSTLNTDLLSLCSTTTDEAVRDSASELQLLIRWAEELAATPHNGDREAAIAEACSYQCPVAGWAHRSAATHAAGSPTLGSTPIICQRQGLMKRPSGLRGSGLGTGAVAWMSFQGPRR